ncbi:MAG: hypothetical protein DKM24_05285 [Candidatus Melainabacteria bacterium]|nr:MAG: hypothetical protein DKM24_05285 [Candidatus Melainabacteria bacterium]
MKKFNILIISAVLMLFIGGIGSTQLLAANAPAKQPAKNKTVTPVTPIKKNGATTSQAKSTKSSVATPTQTYTYAPVKPLDLVAHPNAFVNKRVKIRAKFDKFSSLGLDYKPAMRSSQKYITFLICRDNTANVIPLSELKNFLKREVAEKNIDLETGDIIEYSGLVFSNALGDVWLEVEDFKVIQSKAKDKKATTTK